MRTALRKMGNSAGMIVPKAVLVELGSEIGEEFEIGVEGGQIVAAPVGAKRPRNGWGAAAAGIGLAQAELSAAEEAELGALAAELKTAATRMEARLDEASAAVRAALDPAREAALRARLEAELKGSGEGLLDALVG